MNVRITRENMLVPGDIVCWTDPRQNSFWEETVMVIGILPDVFYGLSLDRGTLIDFPLSGEVGIMCYVIDMSEDT